jgi:hypothetical protein
MNKFLETIGTRAKGRRPDDPQVVSADRLAYGRENVWEKDRAAIAKAVKRLMALRRRDDEAEDHGKLSTPASQPG